MDKPLADQLAEAIRCCGLYSDEQTDLATRLLVSPSDDTSLADQLYEAKVLTPYMFRKVRAGRTLEILFGPYLILDKIGEGGMGKVYRAVQCFAQQMVALKVVRQHLMANKTVKKRYQKEAAAAAALDHPNVVKLFEADEVNGRYFLAMEYVDGIDLARIVKEFGSPPNTGLPQWQEPVEYIRQAALGLQHAHDKGLIHRDIKPSNLLVYGERALPGTDGKANLKILDMGLVRSLMEDDDANRTELTRDGTVVGTPDYMSPEQAKNSSTVDHRADLYSLGCTLYYMLRGRPPFPDGSPIDKLLRHQLDPAPDIRTDRPDVPVALAEVIAKLLAKRPEDRYQSANATAVALAALLSGTSTKTPLPVHEPFSFSDDPNAIYQPEPVDTVVMPSGGGSVVASPPPPPQVRLRVVTPKAAPPKKAPTKVVAAVYIPKPENAPPSSDSLPGTIAPASKTVQTNEDETENFTPRRTRRAVPKEQAKKSPMLLFIGLAVGATLVLGVAGIFLFKANRDPNKNTASSVATTNTPITTPPTKPNTPPASTSRGKLSYDEILPDDSRGVIVIHPKSYMKILAYEKVSQNSVPGHFQQLLKRTLIDTQKLDRVVLAFSGPSNHTTLIADGPFMSNGFLFHLTGLPGVKEASPIRGMKSFSFASPFQNLRHGTMLGEDAYVLSTQREIISQLQIRYLDKKLLTPNLDLQTYLDAHDDEEHLLAFAATSGYSLPEGDTLGDHGIRFVGVELSLRKDQIQIKLLIRAIGRDRLRDFLSIYLATRMVEQHPGIKPLTELLTDADSDGKQANQFEVKYKLTFPWDKAHETLDALLPKPKD
ncbi:MAG: serine/threonine protein kinase [Fimbriiglobus sp.]